MNFDNFIRARIGPSTDCLRMFLRRFIRRTSIADPEVSIISNNCVAGMIYNFNNMKFNSPTINLWFAQGFPQFVTNLNEYLLLPLEEVVNDELLKIRDKVLKSDSTHDPNNTWDYPFGKISGSAGSVYIGFLHYSNFLEAKSKWNERKTRINHDKVIILGWFNSKHHAEEVKLAISENPASCNFPTLILYPGCTSRESQIYARSHLKKISKNYDSGKLFRTISIHSSKMWLDLVDWGKFINDKIN